MLCDRIESEVGPIGGVGPWADFGGCDAGGVGLVVGEIAGLPIVGCGNLRIPDFPLVLFRPRGLTEFPAPVPSRHPACAIASTSVQISVFILRWVADRKS